MSDNGPKEAWEQERYDCLEQFASEPPRAIAEDVASSPDDPLIVEGSLDEALSLAGEHDAEGWTPRLA